MRPLVIDDAAKAAVARVISHAEGHHYKLGDKWVPSDDDRFVARLNTYRCVFTYTHSDGAVWRHLSISVPSEHYPNPIAAFAIAALFGFTGWDENRASTFPDDWEMVVNEREHCVVLAQIIRPGALAN